MRVGNLSSSLSSRLSFVNSSISAERLAHPPLGARASVERGVEVVVIINAGKQSGS